MTYWFDSSGFETAHVHFAGHLRDGSANDARSTFEVVASVDPLVQGTGPVSLTTRVPDIEAGTWDVKATPVQPAPPNSPSAWVRLKDPQMPTAAATGRTTATLLVQNRAPGVWFGIWPALVAVGALFALALQAYLAASVGLVVGRLLALSGIASLLGLAGAKAYYLLTHRSGSRKLAAPGMSVQGFVLVAVTVLAMGSVVQALPLGAVLDVTAPSLLVGMAVGRLGCLFAGCCVGRPTASRWGLWSSDRRVGLRRIPVQLMESSAAAVLAATSLAAVLAWGSTSRGVVFLESIAAYIIVRQLLFPLRAVARVTAHGRAVALLLAPSVMVAGLAVVALR